MVPASRMSSLTVVSDYDILELGALDRWYDYYGGFAPDRSRDGRRVVDHEIDTQYVGMTANAYEPGEEAGYWHTHSHIEEIYVFLAGTGQMGLDSDIVDVKAGSVIRVGQGVWRTWRSLPDSPGQLRWLCIRAGGGPIAHMPDDAQRDVDRPAPW